ncbi:MAG: hypothetical protein ACYCYF_02225, partial [Anaerolineae bacterium]
MRFRLWPLLLLVILGFVTYWPEATSPALFGDEWGRASEIIYGVGQCPSGASVFLRPLQGCYFAVLSAVLGQAFVLYRFTALAWHLLSSILLFQILCRVIPSHRSISLAAAALFVAYPTNFTLLFLENGYHRLALAVFLAGILILVSAPRRADPLPVIAASLLFLLSLLLYEAHLGLLLLISVIMIVSARTVPRRSRGWHAAPLVLSVAFLVGRCFAQLSHDGVFGHTAESLSASPVELVTRLFLALRVLFQWAWTCAMAELIPYRDSPVALVTLGIILVVAVAATVTYHTISVRAVSSIDRDEARPPALMVLGGIAAAAAGYVPMLIALNLDLSYLGSRMHVVPSMGAALALSAGLYLAARFLSGPRRGPVAFAVLCVPLLLLGVAVHWRSHSCVTQVWESQKSLWYQIMSLAPGFARRTTVGIVVKNSESCYGGPEVLQSGAWGVEGALSLLYGRRDLGGWFGFERSDSFTAVPAEELSTHSACQVVFIYDQGANEVVLLGADSPTYGTSTTACIVDASAAD